LYLYVCFQYENQLTLYQNQPKRIILTGIRMKKSAVLLLLLTCLSSLHGQESVFLETCGNTDVSSPRKVDIYSGWDNLYPVIFTRTKTLDGYADVRITTTTTNHVWFPSDKNSDLIIMNIPASNYQHLKLSFDIAAYKLAGANLNKLTVYCNGTALILPSMTFTSSKFLSVSDLVLPNSDVITLRFEYTAEKNTNGYRLDNFTITGDKVTLDTNTPKATDFSPIISANTIRFPFLADGSIVVLFNTLGNRIQSSVIRSGYITLNRNIKKGIYLVHDGKSTWKIIL